MEPIKILPVAVVSMTGVLTTDGVITYQVSSAPGVRYLSMSEAAHEFLTTIKAQHAALKLGDLKRAIIQVLVQAEPDGTHAWRTLHEICTQAGLTLDLVTDSKVFSAIDILQQQGILVIEGDRKLGLDTIRCRWID